MSITHGLSERDLGEIITAAGRQGNRFGFILTRKRRDNDDDNGG